MKNQWRQVMKVMVMAFILERCGAVAAPASAGSDAGPKVDSRRSGPRTDLNPAVLYLQAFGQYPALSDVRDKGLLAEPPTLSQVDGEERTARFDAMFKLIRRASRMNEPCDWGTDPADGPAAIGPNLVSVRRSYQAVQARAHYALGAGRDRDAAEDLGAVLVLGRNVGREGALMPTMLGLALESAVVKFVADNFARFSPASLRLLQEQIGRAPARPSIKQAMVAEQGLYLQWFVDRLEQIQSAPPSEAGRAMELARTMLSGALDEKVKDVDRMIDEAHGSVAGLLEYFRQLEPLYRHAGRLAVASPEALERETAAFQQAVAGHSNQLARVAMPNVGKARRSELELVADAAMLRAALALRLDGEPAFRKIQDPFGSGPFVLRTLPADDGDHGFELVSKASESGLKAALKFR